jgi:hypothetical protein
LLDPSLPFTSNAKPGSKYGLLRNKKWLRRFMCCDINMLGVLEHDRSLRQTWGIVKCFPYFSEMSYGERPTICRC